MTSEDEPRRRRGGFPVSWSDWAGGGWLGPKGDLGRFLPGGSDPADALQQVIGPSMDLSGDLGPMAPHLLVDQLLDQARDRLVGRELTMQRPTGAVRFVLEGIDAHPSAMGLAVGQIGDVALTATDVVAVRGRADRVDVRFGNVHVTPGKAPILVTAPVEVVITVGSGSLAEQAASRVPRLAVALADGGVATVGWARHERLGKAEVVPRLEGDRVRVMATGVRMGGRRVGFARGVPTVTIDVPPLPSGFRPYDVVIDGATVVITGAIAELRRPLSLGQLRNLLRRIRGGDRSFDFAESEPPESSPPDG